MDFTLDTEQLALADAVRGLFTGAFERRASVVGSDPGYDTDLWKRSADMGLLGLPYPEEVGGADAGPIEVMIVAEEIGRTRAALPYLDVVVLAGGLIAAAGTAEQQAELLGGIASGESLVVLAHAEPRSRYGTAAHGVTASGDGGAWTLTGVKEPVVWGAAADVLLVTAATDAGTRVFVVDANADGVTRAGYDTHDGARAARIVLDGAVGTPLGDAGETELAATLDRANVALAAEAIGLMQESLNLTVGYLKTRKQFGVTLSKFQALTFRAADMFVALELARSTVQYATMALDVDGLAASRARAQVSGAARLIGQEAIQLHGGIGMTDEYAVGHYTSRLTAIEHTWGDRAWHLARLGAALGDHEMVEILH